MWRPFRRKSLMTCRVFNTRLSRIVPCIENSCCKVLIDGQIDRKHRKTYPYPGEGHTSLCKCCPVVVWIEGFLLQATIYCRLTPSTQCIDHCYSLQDTPQDRKIMPTNVFDLHLVKSRPKKPVLLVAPGSWTKRGYKCSLEAFVAP